MDEAHPTGELVWVPVLPRPPKPNGGYAPIKSEVSSWTEDGWNLPGQSPGAWTSTSEIGGENDAWSATTLGPGARSSYALLRSDLVGSSSRSSPTADLLHLSSAGAGAALEMNSVVSDPRTSQFRDPLIKHVIMEKEIYDCVETQGTPEERRFTRDVETFIEIIQKAQGGRTVTLEKRVEEIICDKPATPGFRISCSVRDVTLEQAPPPAEQVCRPTTPAERAQPTDPAEMNTVITSRQDTVKTMKVDKELLICDEAFFAELYLFTEIVEARAGAPADTIRPTEKKFQAILCLIRGSGGIENCRHFVPAGVDG